MRRRRGSHPLADRHKPATTRRGDRQGCEPAEEIAASFSWTTWVEKGLQGARPRRLGCRGADLGGKGEVHEKRIAAAVPCPSLAAHSCLPRGGATMTLRRAAALPGEWLLQPGSRPLKPSGNPQRLWPRAGHGLRIAPVEASRSRREQAEGRQAGNRAELPGPSPQEQPLSPRSTPGAAGSGRS